MAAAAHTRPAAPVLVEPAAAAQDPVRAVHLRVVDVPAPVPDVAQHVVQAPRVGSLAAHLVDAVAGVSAVPGDLVQRPVPGTGRTRATRVFPFAFGRQPVPVGAAIPFDTVGTGPDAVCGCKSLVDGQGVAEPHRVPPRDALHG